MTRIPENNSVTRNGRITTIVTDDIFIFEKYRVAGISGIYIAGIGFVMGYSESVNISDYTLPPNYTVLTVKLEMTGE